MVFCLAFTFLQPEARPQRQAGRFPVTPRPAGQRMVRKARASRTGPFGHPEQHRPPRTTTERLAPQAFQAARTVQAAVNSRHPLSERSCP